MNKFVSILAAAGILSAAASSLSAQQKLTLSQVNPNCASFFAPSQMTTGNVNITFTNNSQAPIFVAWMDFQGVANLIGSLDPGQSFTDQSHPQHVYVVMDGSLTCLRSERLGSLIGAHVSIP